ncbi:hypothetical protein JCM9957A_00030 [Kineosporia succinea]
MLDVLEAFPSAAAYVLGPALDVLAENAIAGALLSPFGRERSMPRICSPIRRPLPCSRAGDASPGHGSRAAAERGRFPHHPAIGSLVQELTARFPEFTALWNDHEVAALTRAFKVFVHPDAGASS